MAEDTRRRAAELYSQRASLHEARGLFHEAIEDLTTALGHAPADPAILARRGALHLRQRTYDQAQSDLDQAAALLPEDVDLRDQRSRLAFVQFRLADALEDLRFVLARRPEALHCRLREGEILALLERGAEAEASRSALEQRPGCGAWAGFLGAYMALCRGEAAAARAGFDAAAGAAGPEQADIGEKARFFRTVATALEAKGERTMENENGGKLLLCGLGVQPPQHATIEELQALGDCDVVFCNMAGDIITEFLAPFCRDLRPIAFRDENDHSRCVETVLAECRPGRTVGFVTYGHALVFGPLAGELLARCRERGVECRAFPSVSSLDHFLASMGKVLGHDFRGFQVYEAAEVLEPAFTANGRLPSIVFFANAHTAAEMERLGAGLQRFYPKGHNAFIFGGRLDRGPAREIKLSELAAHLPELDGRRQIFVPPA